MDRASTIFCGASLAVSLLIATLFVSVASISNEQLETSRTPAEAYEMDDVDMGEFGRVPVQELVDYYINNPPVKAAGEITSGKPRFQGC